MKASDFCFDPKHRKYGSIMCVKCQKSVGIERDFYMKPRGINVPFGIQKGKKMKSYPTFEKYLVSQLKKNWKNENK